MNQHLTLYDLRVVACPVGSRVFHHADLDVGTVLKSGYWMKVRWKDGYVSETQWSSISPLSEHPLRATLNLK